MAKNIPTLVLRVFMILTFSAWILLLFIKPTQFWSKNWKQVEDGMQKTIFKYNGADFLVFTFPIIALAMFGLVKLYLQSSSSGLTSPNRSNWLQRKVKRCATVLFSPFIITTPLGILSMIEVIAICLFLTLLVWTLYVRISIDYRKLIPAKSLTLNLWQLKFLKVATRCGLLSEICLALLLFPILRGISILRFIGIQFEASVRYHIWLGTTLIIFATLHGVGTLFIWGTSHHIQNEIWRWQKQGRVYLAGEISLLTGLVIWLSSLPVIRRLRFNVFFYMHHLYIVFIVFFLLHAGDRHFYIIFPGVFLFGLDKLFRVIQSRFETQILSARIFPSKVIELILPKDPKLKYKPTSVLFIKIPIISKFHWHPFSITSSSSNDDKTISVMIKCEGRWTNSVYELLHQEMDSPCRKRCIDVAIEGPYGPPSFEFTRYDGLILIGGGIGITPILSILQEIASSNTTANLGKKSPSKIELIYVTKNSQDICLLNSVSNLIQNQPCNFKLTVFVTREKKGKTSLRELLHQFSSTHDTILFESSNCILGPETPLFMATIIGFSTILFLLFLCFFNHFVMPPGKKLRSEMKTPSAVVDLFLLCSFFMALVCVAILAIVLRRRNSKDALLLTRDKGDSLKELGSIEYILSPEEHEICYGLRPNFPDLLSKSGREFGKSNSVGVVVCGPESMKKSVALAIKIDGAKKENPSFVFRSLNFSF